MAAKKRNFFWRKNGLKFLSKTRDSHFVKNATFFFGFSVVVQPNEGVQLKDRLF